MIQQNVSALPQELPVGVATSAVEINQFAQSGTVPTIIQLPVLATNIAKTLPSPQDLIVIPSTTSNVIPPGRASSSTFHMESPIMNGCTENLGGHNNHTQLQLIVVQPPAPLPPPPTVAATSTNTTIATATSTTSIVELRKQQIDTAPSSLIANHSPLHFDDITSCSISSNATKRTSDDSLQEANHIANKQHNKSINRQDCKTIVNLANNSVQNINKNSNILMPEWEDAITVSNSLKNDKTISCDKNESKSRISFLGFSNDDKDEESYTAQTLRELLLQRRQNANSSLITSDVLMTRTPTSFHTDGLPALGSNKVTNSITTVEELKVPENNGSLTHYSTKANILEKSYHAYSTSSRKEDCDEKIYSFDQENTAFLSSVTKICFDKQAKSPDSNTILNGTIFHSLSVNSDECEQNIAERTLNSENPSITSVPLISSFISPGKEMHNNENIGIGTQNVSCESVSAKVKDATFPTVKKEAKNLARVNQEISDMQSSVDHISAMTLLPEMELLSMINPSTFDNV